MVEQEIIRKEKAATCWVPRQDNRAFPLMLVPILSTSKTGGESNIHFVRVQLLMLTRHSLRVPLTSKSVPGGQGHTSSNKQERLKWQPNDQSQHLGALVPENQRPTADATFALCEVSVSSAALF